MPDDVKDIPDVDLSSIQDDSQEPKPETPPHPEDPKRNIYGQFRTAEDVLKGYKEIQGFSTKVSQENAELKKRLDEERQRISEMEERMKMATPPPNYNYQPPRQQEDFDTKFTRDPESTLNEYINQQIQTARIGDVLVEEREKDPEEFNERYTYVQQLAQQYPHLASSPQGVRNLFKQADKTRTEYRKKSAYKSLEYIFDGPLTEEQMARLKEVVGTGKKQPEQQKESISGAYMPDSSGLRAGLQNQNPNFDAEIDKHAKEGDVDATIQTLFKKHLST